MPPQVAGRGYRFRARPGESFPESICYCYPTVPNERLLHTSNGVTPSTITEENPRIRRPLAVRNNTIPYYALRGLALIGLREVGRRATIAGVERESVEVGWFVLRPFRTDDVGWVHEVSVDPAVGQFVDIPSPYLLEHATFFVEQLAIAGWDRGDRFEFLAEDAETGQRLGRVGLGMGERRTAEVGYWVDPRARGRGVATEAVKAISGWAFSRLGLELIEWRAEVGNHASRRVAEKAGFLMEATLRQRLVHRGLRVDAWVGSLTKDDQQFWPGARDRDS
jgi:RimJ/RimL family protein N-acetyltransferase